VRALSQMPFMKWVPFFPISERLNVFTAGSLLALMAVPTIFTFAEDAPGQELNRREQFRGWRWSAPPFPRRQ